MPPPAAQVSPTAPQSRTAWVVVVVLWGHVEGALVEVVVVVVTAPHEVTPSSTHRFSTAFRQAPTSTAPNSALAV